MDITPTLPTVSPGRPAYAAAIAAYNLLAEISPDRAVITRSTPDVQAALAWARDQGLRVSVISTGHAAHSSPDLAGSLLIRTEFDGPVTIDPVARTATIPAGTRWREVVAAAAEHGLAAPHGSSGDVGAVGYLLGGGASFYGRLLGLGANSVLDITLVRADGRVVTVSADEDPELFWALRGGGGGVGIVTAVTIRLHPMWRALTGITFWDGEHALPLLRAWHAWSRTAPREITTSFRLLNLPPMAGLPGTVTGRPVVAVDGAVAIESADALEDRARVLAAMLDPMRALAAPILDDWAPRPVPAVAVTHLDPPQPIPFVADHMLLSGLTPADLLSLVDVAGPASGSALTSVELRQLGGAFADPPVPGGAFDRTGADFALLQIGVVVPEVVSAARQRARMARVRAALALRDTGYTLPTFVESMHQHRRTFDDATRAHVGVVRERVDPDGVFVFRGEGS